ncbi:flp pilus-assembly TadE/G-like family protein [Alloscardovia criceti]|uniref:flp pilus-assembly TadE/G-like family protein n=1 Tax=Alloscardovia criceti TaxID=356828 RepID=UPI00036E029B|nr:flp pilus-assembly TadE/G-like family protein [Alloscardovia criceti]
MCTAKTDEGSGTVLGVSLVAICGALAFLVACTGSYLVCASTAQSVAQRISFELAFELQLSELENKQISDTQICSQAQMSADESSFIIEDCRVMDRSVQVSIRGFPSMNFLPQPVSSARAGPRECLAKKIGALTLMPRHQSLQSNTHRLSVEMKETSMPISTNQIL